MDFDAAGLYRGSGATVARATFLSGSQLGSYDCFKSIAKSMTGLGEGPVLHLSCSLLSGLIAQTVIQVDFCWFILMFCQCVLVFY